MTAKRYGVSLWGDKNDETVVMVVQRYKYICTVWARVLQRNRAKRIYLFSHPSVHPFTIGIHAWSGICKLENKELTAMSPSLSPETWEPGKPKSKGFGVVNKAEIDVFLELSCFFDDQTDDDTLNSSKESKFVLLMPFCSIHTLSKLDDVHRH